MKKLIAVLVMAGFAMTTIAAKKPAPPTEADYLVAAKEDLARYLDMMSASGTKVELGSALARPRSPSREAYRIVVADGVVHIGGGSPAGVAYGVYRFLREAGCDWVMPGADGEVVPEKPRLPLADGTDIESAPDYAFRRGYFMSRDKALLAALDRWCLRLGAQIAVDPDFTPGGHVWSAIIRENKAAFEADPSLYALRREPDGSIGRCEFQFEETDPRVIEMSIEHIRSIFRKNGWAKDRAVCLPMGPSDGGALSISPASTLAGSGRFDPESARPDGTDNIILYLNTILEKTKTEFPNLRLGFFLYSWHGGYPVRYTPDPRIVPVIADINFSRMHGIGDESSKTRYHYEGIIRKWAALGEKQGNEFVYRPYSWNLAENWLPYSKLAIWGRELPFFHKMGVRRFNLNYTIGWNINAPHNYLALRMAWDTSLDWRKVLDDFCRAAYGPAAATMARYHLAIDARQRESGQEAGAIWSFPLVYDRAFADEMSALLDRAETEAATPAQRRRVVMFGREPLGHLKRYLEYREALGRFDFAAASRIWDLAVDETEAEGRLNALNVPRWPRLALFKSFKSFNARAVQCSTGDYSIVAKLPDAMKTAIDPNNNGEDLGFFRPAINDRDWFVTKTWSSTWDAQGLAAYRTGAVWYRVRLPIAADLGAYRGLFVGGADNTVMVWVNGKFAGRAGPAPQRAPQVFDVSEMVEPGKENLVVVKVERNGNYEIGTGGLMMPCFVFSGPCPPPPPPDASRPYEILPGGAIRYLDKKETVANPGRDARPARPRSRGTRDPTKCAEGFSNTSKDAKGKAGK